MTTKADEYREKALACERTANKTTDQTIKQQWQGGASIGATWQTKPYACRAEIQTETVPWHRCAD
jgi:hypothetical protein